MGFLSRVVEPDGLDAAIEAEIAPYLACAPGAVADAKRLLLSMGPQMDEARIAAFAAELAARWETDEAQDRVAAFFDRKR